MPNRTIVFCGIGQSYFQAGYSTTAFYGFCLAVRQLALLNNALTVAANTGLPVAADDFLMCRNEAVGGSAILEYAADAPGYWVNNDYTNGPLLTAALTRIAGYASKPRYMVYSHGQQDALFGADAAQGVRINYAITQTLWPAVRNALLPANPNGIPIFVDMVGPRYAGSEISEFVVRDAIIDAINSTTRAYRGSETYHLPLGQTTHPTNDKGYKWMGAHTGRKLANWLLTGNTLDGPSIDSVTIVPNGVNVSIKVPVGQTLIKPAVPDNFGLYTASEQVIPITGYTWVGNVLNIQCDNSQLKTFRYPINMYRQSIIENVIRLTNPNPLFDGEPGLVLESRKTITF